MDTVKLFEDYMQDFELTIVDDDWSRIPRRLTEDFVHERNAAPLMSFRYEGVDAALAQWREHVDNLDRQFDRRIFVPLGPPTLDRGAVRLRWIFLGVIQGALTFVDEGWSSLTFGETGSAGSSGNTNRSPSRGWPSGVRRSDTRSRR